MKVLFASSPRDDALVENQEYIDTGVFQKTTEGGEKYQQRLIAFLDELRSLTANSAFYIFPGWKDDKGLTTHTMLMLFSFLPMHEVTPAQWISNAVDGKLEDYGLDLLE